VNDLLAFDAISRSILARHLQTQLTDATWVEAEEAAAVARLRLESLSFDQAPVRSNGNELVGFVERELLPASGLAGDAMKRLDEHSVESADASVADVLQALSGPLPMIFVVDGHQISGFITRSDFNKHPARAHFYLLLADIEIVLAALVVREVPDLDAALGILAPGEARKIRRRFARDSAAGTEVDLAAAMDLGHLLIVAATVDVLRGALEVDRMPSWADWVVELVEFRNAVMHPTKEFLGRHRSLADIIAVEDWVKHALERLRGAIPMWVPDAS
jgi:hypothetical protein